MVADVHVQPGDLFAVQGDHIAQQAMGAHMVGADVEHHFFPAGAHGIEDAAVLGLALHGILVGVGRHLGGPPGIVFPEGMPLPVGGHDEPL